MNLSFRILAKIALILVVIGFFMPISCNLNGFQIAKAYMEGNKVIVGLLFYIVFISALAGIALGVLLFLNKISLNPLIDLIVVGVCTGTILILLITQKNHGLQIGAIFAILGGLGALALQIVSKVKNE
ncbi:MAG: hypothetical protein FWD13_09685 [Treponema sp.]|nr:hypothetical protein [Treponema sp.]